MTQKKKYRLRIEDKCSFCFFQLQTFLWCCALRRVSRWSQSWRGVKSLSPMQLTRSIATNFFRYFILSKYNFLSFFIITSLKSYENGFSLYWLVNGLDFIRSSSSWHVQVWLSNILNSEELPDDLFRNKWRMLFADNNRCLAVRPELLESDRSHRPTRVNQGQSKIYILLKWFSVVVVLILIKTRCDHKKIVCKNESPCCRTSF